MHVWPAIDSEVKRCICSWGARAQQTCSNGLLVCPLGFCSLCIRVHLWRTAAVNHVLPCHASRSQMKHSSMQKIWEAYAGTPWRLMHNSMGRSWSLGLYTQPKAACQTATGTEGMSVLARIKGHACSTSMASRRRLCLITCTSACGSALAPLLDCHDFCTLSSPQQLHGMPLLRQIPEPRWGRDTGLIFVAPVPRKGCDGDPTQPPNVQGSIQV